MIDLYYWTTPNGHKITIFLEEAGLPCAINEAREILFGQDQNTVR